MKPWKSSYRSGSFRGVPFVTEDHEAAGGRRGPTHEFPQRDLPYAEDTGARAKRYSINIFVLGDDVYDQRDALIAALEERGPGVLVHPFLGQLDVICRDWALTESTTEGGIARFSVEFDQSGRALAGEVSRDTAEQSRDIGKAAADAGIAMFEAEFSVDGLPSFAVDGATFDIERFAKSALGAAGLLGGAGKALRAFESGIDQLNGALDLVYAPIRLANNVTAMVRGVAALGLSPVLRLRALTRLFDDNRRPRTVIGRTPVRNAERANAQAFAELIAITSASEIANAVSAIRFASRDEAVSLRASVTLPLDEAASDYANLGRDDAANALDTIRFAIVRDVAARGSTLAPIGRITPEATLPSLVIAHRLYGAADLSGNEADLVTRNRIPHPGFIAAARALEYLREVRRV